MELLTNKKARIKDNQLVFDDAITEKEWEKVGLSLSMIEGGIQFFIGDWACYGEKKGFTGKYTNGEVYDKLEELTGLKRNTIQRYKSVAEATSWNRFQNLPYTHHQEVAPLPPDQQQRYLTMAAENNLSVKQLREEINSKTYAAKDLDKLIKKSEMNIKMKPATEDWVNKNLSNYDEIDIDILNSLLPIIKRLKKEYGYIVKEQVIQLIKKININEL
jgi:hypothetical protein